MPVRRKISQLPNFEPTLEQQRRIEEARRYEEEREQREHQRRAVELWDKAGVGNLHAQAKLMDLLTHDKWAKAWDAAQNVVDHKGMLVLLGDRGNGKTQLGVELIRRASKQLKRGLYTRARQIGMAIRESYDSPKLTEMECVKRFTQPYLLVIDEVQERPDTDFEQRTFTMILDMRYETMRPTVLIANASPAQFKKLVGSSVTDRIHDRGSTIEFKWPSFRRAK